MRKNKVIKRILSVICAFSIAFGLSTSCNTVPVYAALYDNPAYSAYLEEFPYLGQVVRSQSGIDQATCSPCANFGGGYTTTGRYWSIFQTPEQKTEKGETSLLMDGSGNVYLSNPNVNGGEQQVYNSVFAIPSDYGMNVTPTWCIQPNGKAGHGEAWIYRLGGGYETDEYVRTVVNRLKVTICANEEQIGDKWRFTGMNTTTGQCSTGVGDGLANAIYQGFKHAGEDDYSAGFYYNDGLYAYKHAMLSYLSGATSTIYADDMNAIYNQMDAVYNANKSYYDNNVHLYILYNGGDGQHTLTATVMASTNMKVAVQKESSDPTYTNNYPNIYKLQGAVFGVWDNASCSGEPVARLTTNASGYAESGELPVKDYWIKEITAPPGYAVNTTVYKVE